MSRFSEIDLAGYALPDILEALDVEAYLAANKTRFTQAWDAIRESRPPIDTLALEHEPVTAQLRVAAELERMLRGHVNDRIKQVTLAGARGAMLDHIAMTYFAGLTRRIVVAANATTGAPAILEDDETFRSRIALSPESWSTCGPEGAYLFWSLTASGEILDVAAYSEDEGVCLAPRIRVVILPRTDATMPDASLRAAVQTVLNRREIRPMGDLVTVESAIPLAYNVAITLKVRAGASAEIVRQAAEKRVRAYCEGLLRWIGDDLSGPVWLIGRRILRDTIAGRAYGDDPNIVEVIVTAPAADINAPDAGYTEAALAGVGTEGFAPLEPGITAHLFRAPRLGTLTITTETATGGVLG
jgi:phage-related baseplate assembly protein